MKWEDYIQINTSSYVISTILTKAHQFSERMKATVPPSAMLNSNPKLLSIFHQNIYSWYRSKGIFLI